MQTLRKSVLITSAIIVIFSLIGCTSQTINTQANVDDKTPISPTEIDKKEQTQIQTLVIDPDYTIAAAPQVEGPEAIDGA